MCTHLHGLLEKVICKLKRKYVLVWKRPRVEHEHLHIAEIFISKRKNICLGTVEFLGSIIGRVEACDCESK